MGFITKSPWIIHYDGSSCNGCDIEVLACLTPVYDVERLGIINTGNPKHADILLITGSINEQNKEVVLNIYHQMPDPKVVVAIGICATSGGIFRECYNVAGGVDKILPVDVYVPGCAARPESIIEGVAKALGVLEQKRQKFAAMASGLEHMVICRADVEDSVGIFGLKNLVLKNDTDGDLDFDLTGLGQAPEDIIADFENKFFYKAVMNSQIVGVVSARLKHGVCLLDKSIVHPLYRNHGIAAKLLEGLEKGNNNCLEFEVTVPAKERKDLLFYQRHGYKLIKPQDSSIDKRLARLKKTNPRYREAGNHD